jgi:hypothetical protein
MDSEREMGKWYLGQFEVHGSIGEKLAAELGPDEMWTKTNLRTLGFTCSQLIGRPFPRDYQRNRTLIFIWLTDNYAEIAPLLTIVSLE